MGIAFVDSGDLLYHGVKVIERQRSPHEALKEGRKIILRLIRDLKPQVLVYEKAFFANNRTAALLNVFVDEIRVIAKRKNLKILGFAPREMKKLICGNGKATKQEVAWVVVSRFPELKVYLHQDRQWKERYWSNVFDAVALAMLASGNGQTGNQN